MVLLCKKIMFGFVLLIHKLDISGAVQIFAIHASGEIMTAQGMDGISWGAFLDRVLRG